MMVPEPRVPSGPPTRRQTGQSYGVPQLMGQLGRWGAEDTEA